MKRTGRPQMVKPMTIQTVDIRTLMMAHKERARLRKRRHVRTRVLLITLPATLLAVGAICAFLR